ncbi:hypothetical protein [Pararhodonellum marinum]|uniref:hypothetical protein n=1 Tax=Pararhodonellum marinum TaxID=2755358 RepID=UPI00188DD2FE|nr:hypothetical protein [Pararhodonellum marinum]
MTYHPKVDGYLFDKTIFNPKYDFVQRYEYFGSGGSAGRFQMVSKRMVICFFATNPKFFFERDGSGKLGSPKLEVGSGKLGVGSRKSEVGSPKLGVGGWK